MGISDLGESINPIEFITYGIDKTIGQPLIVLGRTIIIVDDILNITNITITCVSDWLSANVARIGINNSLTHISNDMITFFCWVAIRFVEDFLNTVVIVAPPF